MPVLKEEPVEASQIFEQLGDNLRFAFDISQGLIYWPQGELYTLVELLPGTGYLVNVEAETSLDFSIPGKKSGSISPQQVNQPGLSSNTGSQHVIVVAPEALSHFNKGSIFAIENESGKTLGTTPLTDKSLALILIAQGDDPTTDALDGFTANEKILITCIHAQTFELTELTPEFNTEIGLEDSYTEWGISKISNFKNSSGINDPGNAGKISISPNPAHSKININWNVEQEGPVTITLLNLHGQFLETITTNHFKAGQQSHSWPCAHLSEGIYFISINTNASTQTCKLIIIK
jgi:hypothetical protein